MAVDAKQMLHLLAKGMANEAALNTYGDVLHFKPNKQQRSS